MYIMLLFHEPDHLAGIYSAMSVICMQSCGLVLRCSAGSSFIGRPMKQEPAEHRSTKPQDCIQITELSSVAL